MAQRLPDPDRGLGGPRPRAAEGAAPEVPGRLAGEIRRWAIEGPAACGLDRASRADAEPADHLYETRGIAAGRSAALRLCEKPGARVYRPTGRLPRAGPAEQATARGELADLRRGRRPAAPPC